MIDPTPWSAWGVLGLLGLAFIVLVGIVWKLFMRTTFTLESQTKTVMDFVNVHRSETTRAMEGVASTVSTSYEKMATQLGRNTRALQEMLLLHRFTELLQRTKSNAAPGTQLSEDEIARIFRVVAHEQSQGRREDD